MDDPYKAPKDSSPDNGTQHPVSVKLFYVTLTLWFAGGAVDQLTQAPSWIGASLAGAGTLVFCVAAVRLFLFERRR